MPTVIIGNNTGDDYSGVEDTRLVQTAPTTNYGSNDRFDIMKGVTNQYSHGIIRFTGLSNLPATAEVSSAVLSIRQATGGYVQTYSFRRLLRNWIVNQSTWNIYSTGNNWSTAGATSDGNDRVSDVSATLTSGVTSGIYYHSASLSSDVQNFINGVYANHGWHGERTDGAGDSQNNRYHSSDSTDGSRPYLTVTYTTSGGTQDLEGSFSSSSDLSGQAYLQYFLTGDFNSVSNISGLTTLDLKTSGYINSLSSISADVTLDIGISGQIISTSSMSLLTSPELSLSGVINAESEIIGNIELSLYVSGVISVQSLLELQSGFDFSLLEFKSPINGVMNFKSNIKKSVENKSVIVRRLNIKGGQL